MAITSSYMLATSMLLCSLAVAIATAGGEYENSSPSELSHDYAHSSSQKVEDKSEKVTTPPGVFEKPTQYDQEKQTDKPKVEESKPEKKVTFPVSYDPTKTIESRKQLRAHCEGVVLCKSGQEFSPIKGAKAIVTCKTVNGFGYEVSPASTYTSETNEKGYFLMPLPQMKFVSNYLRFTNCKVEILHFVSEKCKILSNEKKWKNSATYLSSFRILNDRKVKLYTVKPFVYTEEVQHTPIPTGYDHSSTSEVSHEYVYSSSQKVGEKSEKVTTHPGAFEKPTQFLEKDMSAGSGYGSGEASKVEESKPEKQSTSPVNSYAPKPNGTDEEEEKKTSAYQQKPTDKEKKTGYDSTKTTEFNAHKSEKQLRADCEGLVLCKSGHEFYPIQGAKASIICKTVNRFGYEAAPASTYTSETNEKGYFLMPLPKMKFEFFKFTSCKVEIEHSVSQKCKTPSKGNKSNRSSTYLSSYRILNDRKVKLYSVEPFVYTEEAEHTQTPTGY